MHATPAQLKANLKWRHKNKARNRLITYHNSCRHYIKKECKTDKQLDEVEDWIKARRNEIEK